MLVASACTYQAKQTLAGVLQSGEWTCVETEVSEDVGDTRFVWAADGTWTQHSTGRYQDNGDAMSFESVVSGKYFVREDSLSMKGEHAEFHLMRNGLPQSLSAQEAARIERAVLLIYDGDWQEVTQWDLHRIVLKDVQHNEVSCKR